MSVYYVDPIKNDDTQHFTGNPNKVYTMSCGDVVVTVYYGKGIEVYYAPPCQTHRWAWRNREHAWNWANSRKQHLGYVKAGGKYARSYGVHTRL